MLLPLECSEVGHQLPRRGKAADVADLGDQSDGGHRVDAAQRAQCRHYGLEPPALCGFNERRGEPLHPLLGPLRGQLVFGQGDTIARVLELLIGDPSKAHKVLGWKHETSFEGLVSEMMEADLAAVAQERRGNGP